MLPVFIISYLILIASFVNCDNLPFVTTNKYKEISSVMGTVGHIPCAIDAPMSDVLMILWFKDDLGTPIYSYDARNEKEPRHQTVKNSSLGLRLYFRIYSQRRRPALIVRDLRAEDAGLYRCRIDFRSSPTVNAVVHLTVIVPPTHLEIRDSSQTINRPISDQDMSTTTKQHSRKDHDLTVLGPFWEGQDVKIVCSAYGGNPLSSVIWMKNGMVVDMTYSTVDNTYSTNELSLDSLGRNENQNLYICQATNNNETKAISHRVVLDVYLPAKLIELHVPEEMIAGSVYQISCQTIGAYPTVKIEFWKQQKRIGSKIQMKSDGNNTAVGMMSFKPEVSDEDVVLSCKADNPWLSLKPIVASSRRLKIKYAPIAILRFGMNKTTNFYEGESVLFECHVKANPQIYNTIMWFHEGKQLRENATAGVHISGMTMILRHLSEYSGGRYFCEAINDVGKSVSNSLLLVMNISPKCTSSAETTIQMALGEIRELNCSILAWPADLKFYWTFNRSQDITPVSNMSSLLVQDNDSMNYNRSSKVSSPSFSGDFDFTHLNDDSSSDGDMLSKRKEAFQGTTVLVGKTTSKTYNNSSINGTLDDRFNLKNFNVNSTNTAANVWVESKRRVSSTNRDYDGDFDIFHHSLLSYHVKSLEDFGTISCWARNSFSVQYHPCLFHILIKSDGNNTNQARVEVASDDNETGHGKLTSQGESNIDVSTVSSKLQGTLCIFLMVVLIFITSLGAFCLLSYLISTLVQRKRTWDEQKACSTEKMVNVPSEEPPLLLELPPPSVSSTSIQTELCRSIFPSDTDNTSHQSSTDDITFSTTTTTTTVTTTTTTTAFTEMEVEMEDETNDSCRMETSN